MEIQVLDNLQEYSVRKPQKITVAGKILLGLTGGFAIGLTVLCAPFVSPALRKICLPYIPATDTQIKNILLALNNRKGTLIDLGSGDGRVVLEAAKRKFVAHGVELNPWLVLYSKVDAFRKGLRSDTKFFHRDLWKFDVSNYENVVIFGVEQMMPDLEKKLLQQCNKDCHIIACRFPLPNLRPKGTTGYGIDTVWVYELPK